MGKDRPEWGGLVNLDRCAVDEAGPQCCERKFNNSAIQTFFSFVYVELKALLKNSAGPL